MNSVCCAWGPAIFCATSAAWIFKLIRSQKYLKQRMVALLPGLYTAGNHLQRHNIGAKKVPSAAQRDRHTFFRELAERVGLNKSAKFIHVAGTKGKGSTCEYIAAGLRESGVSVGVFTSPHLHTARERIKIGKTLIPLRDFIRLTEVAYKELGDKYWVCFFDLFLCMALHHFGENQVDYVLLETGIGGLYDSTNFAQSPIVTVITNISLDHQNILGDTIEEIALQKAGIIKQGVPIFTTKMQKPSVMTELVGVAREKDAPLHAIEPQDQKGYARTGYAAQRENSSLAYGVLKYLGIDTSSGLTSFYWPCRMEVFSIPILPDHGSIPFVVDGNHNGESTKLFVEGLRRAYPGHRVVVIFGSGADKCMDAMTDEVIAGADVVVPVQACHFKSTAINRVIDVLSDKIGTRNSPLLMGLSLSSGDELNGKIGDNVSWLLDKISNEVSASNGADSKTVIGTCGSLFVACETREYLYRVLPGAFAVDDWVRDADGI